MTVSTIRLFGQDRTRVGYADQEWAVWILGMDDIHQQPTLAAALEFAAEHNAIFADLRLRGGDHSITLHAVVLHHGYAWNQSVEHAHKLDCGHPDCGPCTFDRAIPKAAS